MSNAKRTAWSIGRGLRRALNGSAVVVAAFIGTSSAQAAIIGPVRVLSGVVAGAAGRDAAVSVFKGIPYAAPPLGNLRWRAPQPPAPWQGVRQADRFGHVCVQMQGKAVIGNEDCLTVNVWTAASSSAERRPVLVWSYGGGFWGGTGSNPAFDGEGLARKGVVVVTMNYRSGVLGFLATPELSRESGHNASGNYGMLDQVEVLKWVQKNIAAFGGDPNRVTIAGQSAGGLSTLILLNSPLTQGLYHRAILQSRARGVTKTMAEAEGLGLTYVKAHGSPSLAQLRAMPAEKLKEHDEFVRPVVDGWVIPADFYDLFQKGLAHNVPIMMGHNKDESGAFPQPKTTLSEFRSFAKQRFGPQSDEFLALYPATSDIEAGQAMNNVARDDAQITDLLAATQGSRAGANPTYLYFWTHAAPGPNSATEGAFHGSEINYVFNNQYAVDRPWTTEDRTIAERMSSYWANFAATGDPNGVGLPAWQPIDANSTTLMELGDRFAPMPLPPSPRREFVKRFYLANGSAPGYRP